MVLSRFAKSVAKRVLPEPMRARIRSARYPGRLLLAYLYDYRRYRRWSGVLGFERTRATLEASITIDYHRVEKGLSLSRTRLGFGQAVIARLIENLTLYMQRYGMDRTVRAAVSTLHAYCEFHRLRGNDCPEVVRFLNTIRDEVDWGCPSAVLGGTIRKRREEILRTSRIDFMAFVRSRHSIRHFSKDRVDLSLVRRAVEMALWTPSVCNRQPWRVHVYQEPTLRREILSYQNGCRGFEDEIDTVLLITCDLSVFLSIGERNQCWIDGGLFAMSLVYALHSLGLGTCCLNCSIEPSVDRPLRHAARLSPSEAIIVMIAVGNLPEEFEVAASSRKSVDETMVLA